MKIFGVLGTLLLLLTLTPSVAQADPIVVTSGALTVTGISGGPAYNLAGENFTATGMGGEMGNVGPQSCFPCVTGGLLSLNAFFVGQSLGHGNVTLNGMTFNNVFIAGTFAFGGSPIVIPVSTSNLTLMAPFAFSALMVGCLEPHLICQTQVFSTEVVGSGIATIHLTAFMDSLGNTLFQFNQVTYTFQDSEIPEPASILLLTGGLAAMGGARLKRKKKKVG